jgi:hypothetical protein
MRKGEGFGASEDVAQKVLAALAQWREETREVARQVRIAEHRIARQLERAHKANLQREARR